jgi:RNA polymerase sigma factor (TIGR02999 family)
MTLERSAEHARLTETLYQELKQLAGRHVRAEQAGQTLQPTVLVHEAYLRIHSLMTGDQTPDRALIFSAAAEAMRRLLIEQARRRRRREGAGAGNPVSLSVADGAVAEEMPDDVIDVDDALRRLEAESPDRAAVVRLRFFGGLAMPEVAELLGISLATAERRWAMARAWLHREIASADESEKKPPES